MKLLQSLGLDVLCAALPRVSAPVAKPKVKPQVKAKPSAVKRKAEQIDGGAEDGGTKIARVDGDDDTTRRRSTRRSTIKVDYNEDKLADNRQKQRQKEQAKDAAEDAAGYVGNKLGKRKNDPYVDHQPTDNGVLFRSAGNNTVRSQASRLELGGKLGTFCLTSIIDIYKTSLPSERSVPLMLFMRLSSLAFLAIRMRALTLSHYLAVMMTM